MLSVTDVSAQTQTIVLAVKALIAWFYLFLVDWHLQSNPNNAYFEINIFLVQAIIININAYLGSLFELDPIEILY